MQPVRIDGLLADPPAGVAAALDLVAGFDEALTHGLGRLGEARAGHLAALATGLAGSPLAQRVADAAAKVAAGSVTDEYLAALAAARSALLGSVHDALLGQLDAAAGQEREPWPLPAVPAAESAHANLLGGCRAWLGDIATAGWRGVDHDLVASAGQPLAAVLAQPGLRRLAVLLDGLASELRAAAAQAASKPVPARRWGDLWSRAMLLTRSGPWADPTPARPVSGRLAVLGVDVHEHATAVQVEVHAVLEASDTSACRVRFAVGAMKADAVVGPTVWRLLGGFPVLLAALAGRHTVTVTDLPLTAGGELTWREEQVELGEPADPFTTARVLLPVAVAPPVRPLDRHPVRIAEPVLLSGYTTVEDGAVLEWDGVRLPVDLWRLPACGPLTPALVAASTACLGLLRWDAGRWSVQPVAVEATVKRKAVAVHTSDWAQGPTDPKVVKALARSGDTLAMLRERAGRLLRR